MRPAAEHGCTFGGMLMTAEELRGASCPHRQLGRRQQGTAAGAWVSPSPGVERLLRDLNVDVCRAQRVGFDELPPRLHLIPHQHREHPIRLDGVIDLHPQ